MPTAVMRSKVKPEVEFQYGGRLYFETGNSYMSAADWVIITKFGLLIETDIQKRVTSPEVKLHRSGQHLENQYNIYISFEEWGWTDFEEIRQPNAEWHAAYGDVKIEIGSRTSVWRGRLFLSASLYVSKRGAYWDRLCRDVVGWLVVGCHAHALWPNGAS